MTPLSLLIHGERYIEGAENLGHSNLDQKVKLLNSIFSSPLIFPSSNSPNASQGHTTEKLPPEKFTRNISLALYSPASQLHAILCAQRMVKSLLIIRPELSFSSFSRLKCDNRSSCHCFWSSRSF